jgi:hypothetical protein
MEMDLGVGFKDEKIPKFQLSETEIVVCASKITHSQWEK